MTWVDIFIYFAERYGFTPNTVANMSFPQIYNFMRGKSSDRGVAITNPQQMRAIIEDLKNKGVG